MSGGCFDFTELILTSVEVAEHPWPWVACIQLYYSSVDLCVWGSQLQGARHCRINTIPSPPSKMLQEKTAVIAGSCWRAIYRLHVKEKQPTCRPHFVAQLTRCWSCDVHIWYLTSNRKHIGCLEQGIKGVIARLAIHRKYDNPIYDDARKYFYTQNAYDLVPAVTVLCFKAYFMLKICTSRKRTWHAF